MTSVRPLVLIVLLLGLAATASFHASGAVSERDALVAATLREGVAGSPPLPITSRMLDVLVRTVRLANPGLGLFQAMHLGGGLLLTLAAVFSALTAARTAGRRTGVGLGAGLLVGTAMLFGAGFSRLGLAGGPAATLLFLLSGAALAWTAQRPRAFLGGLCCGLAVAEHPLVLLLVPGFLAIVAGQSLRVPPGRDGRLFGRAALGGLVGLAALLLPLLDSAGRPVLDHGDPGTFGAALACWWGDVADPFWRFAGPRSWGGGFLELWVALWRNAGPIALVLGVAGVVFFFRGAARWARPFLVVHALPALALVIGEPREPALLGALAAWAFLFWTVPTLAGLAERLQGGAADAHSEGGRTPAPAALAAPGLAFLSALLLLLWNGSHLDRSDERGLDWARDSLAPLPENTLLLTANPVHLALAALGERPDVDVVCLTEPSTLNARRSGSEIHALPLPPGGRLTGEYLFEFAGLHAGARPVALAPSAFYDPELRTALLGDRWSLRPHGIAFLLQPRGAEPTVAEGRAASEAWLDCELSPGTPPSPLRDGLTGNAFYARALLQSASLYLDLGLRRDAEREFLFALSLPDASETLAAFGLGRVFFERLHFEEVIRTLEGRITDTDAAAWHARALLANAYLRLGQRDEGLRELERAIPLVPAALRNERQSLQNLRDRVGQGTALPGRGAPAPGLPVPERRR